MTFFLNVTSAVSNRRNRQMLIITPRLHDAATTGARHADLLGLDLYNRPIADISSRVDFVGREYWGTVLARWARVAPAYSIGGVVNQGLIKNFRSIGL